MEYEKLRDELTQIVTEHADECRVYGTRSEASVLDAEKILGVTFPGDYRAFVRDFGAVDFYGFEIYGVLGDQPSLESSVPSCVWITQSERTRGLPADYLVIGSSGDGYTYALSTSAPFHLFAYGGYDFATYPPKQVASGFSELLNRYIDQAKQMIEEDDQ
ncbi:SMI1/KNR4 family protein [Burkholderia ubonensis]|uniref:SMI1/KNR4 family protein n=1 Tax=Burkholderia ubonensis TaxID=101571 RepID=UPI0009B2FFC7|nr:SMI1/KNR4 family protein [Burkholderia ubonensis]